MEWQGASLLLAFLRPTEPLLFSDCATVCVLACLCVHEHLFFRQLFDLESLDCNSCGGDLDAETR